MTKALYFLLLVIVVVTMSCAKKPDTTTIPAGFDLFRTDPEITFFNFEKMPIPAGFFAADSAPFTGTVKFRGGILPSSHFNGQEVTQVDTIVKREQPLELSASYPASGKVPIQMTGLALQSVEPIKVQIGRVEQLWDVEVELSTRQPSRGTMTIRKTDAEGGTFDSELTVYPLFRFANLSDGQEKILDMGAMEMTQEMRGKLTLRASEVAWSHTAAPNALIIRGMNEKFFLTGGAQARFKESSDVCAHGAGGGTSDPDPLRCDVTATRKDTLPPAFRARGTTSSGATVNIYLVEGDCNDSNLLDPILPETTAAGGKYSFGPVTTTSSGIPGIGKQVLVKVVKGGEKAVCCDRVDPQ